jgi:hypothetical protein
VKLCACCAGPIVKDSVSVKRRKFCDRCRILGCVHHQRPAKECPGYKRREP